MAFVFFINLLILQKIRSSKKKYIKRKMQSHNSHHFKLWTYLWRHTHMFFFELFSSGSDALSLWCCSTQGSCIVWQTPACVTLELTACSFPAMISASVLSFRPACSSHWKSRYQPLLYSASGGCCAGASPSMMVLPFSFSPHSSPFMLHDKLL